MAGLRVQLAPRPDLPPLRFPTRLTMRRFEELTPVRARTSLFALSWTVMNTVYTLRYAGQYFRSKPGGIAFGTEDQQQDS